MLLSVPPCGCLGAGLGCILQGTLEGGSQTGEPDIDMGMREKLKISAYENMTLYEDLRM